MHIILVPLFSSDTSLPAVVLPLFLLFLSKPSDPLSFCTYLICLSSFKCFFGRRAFALELFIYATFFSINISLWVVSRLFEPVEALKPTVLKEACLCEERGREIG